MAANGETPDPLQDVPEEVIKRIREHARLIKRRRESDIKNAIRCKNHILKADECSDCRGLTWLDAPLDVVMEIFRQEELITVELAITKPSTHGPVVVYRRNLKKIAGIGIGAGLFIGFVGWQGGRMLWRIMKHGNGGKV